MQEVVGKDITFLIAGNKFDLADKQSLEKHSSSIDSYCNKEHCKHIYTSAKTGYQVDEAFESLINSVVSKVSTAPKQKKKKIEISSSNVEVQKEKKGCC